MELEFQLLSEGELMLGRVLRRKVIEQCEHRQNLINASHATTLLSSYQLTAKYVTSSYYSFYMKLNEVGVVGFTLPAVTHNGCNQCSYIYRQHSLTDFKSELVAEQMTLLDSELFQKIEVRESASLFSQFYRIVLIADHM